MPCHSCLLLPLLLTAFARLPIRTEGRKGGNTTKTHGNLGCWSTSEELDALLTKAAARDWDHRHHSPGWHASTDLQLPAHHPCSPPSGNATHLHALVAVATANVWEKTVLLLTSLASIRDRFELLIVDEQSVDATRQSLSHLNITMVSPSKPMGVTHNWNLAWRYFLNQTHTTHFFIINNDVLVPDGVLTRLMEATGPGPGRCNLVTPMSTVAGMGYVGHLFGIEAVHNLSARAAQFVHHPFNFARVQWLLDLRSHRDSDLQHLSPESLGPRQAFSGFFFGIPRGIGFEFEPGLLFDPKYKIIGQEADVMRRMGAAHRACLHTSTFVHHFKGATLRAGFHNAQPGHDVRKRFVRPDDYKPNFQL